MTNGPLSILGAWMMAYPHDDGWFGRYTVGRYDGAIDDWYFAGEYGEFADAERCAVNVARKHGTRARVTDTRTGAVTYIPA